MFLRIIGIPLWLVFLYRAVFRYKWGTQWDAVVFSKVIVSICYIVYAIMAFYATEFFVGDGTEDVARALLGSMVAFVQNIVLSSILFSLKKGNSM